METNKENFDFDLLDIQLFPEDPIVDKVLDEEDVDLTEIFSKEQQ